MYSRPLPSTHTCLRLPPHPHFEVDNDQTHTCTHKQERENVRGRVRACTHKFTESDKFGYGYQVHQVIKPTINSLSVVLEITTGNSSSFQENFESQQKAMLSNFCASLYSLNRDAVSPKLTNSSNGSQIKIKANKESTVQTFCWSMVEWSILVKKCNNQ